MPKGAFELRFTWPKQIFRLSDADPADAVQTEYGTIRRIFNMDGIQHWELHILGDAPQDEWWQCGLFMHYSARPSASPAGMVAALDMVLGVADDGGDHISGYLRHMRDYFAARAMKAKGDTNAD
jgi:hypothetical protein